MSPTNVLIALMIVALWGLQLSSWRLRNWRATGLGVAITGAIVAAGLLPYPLSPVVRAGLWSAGLWIFLLRSDLVGVAPSKDYDFAEEFVRIFQRMRRLKQTIGKSDPATYVSRFESVVTSIERLEAPPDWIDLQADTVTELRRRLVMMKLLVRPTVEAQRAGEDRWLEIEGRFAAKVKEKGGFWTGWPVSLSRLRRR